MPKAKTLAAAEATNGQRSPSRPYERLHAWTACHQLALAIYRETAGWPKPEMHDLAAETRRAAFSAALNIVEGSAKRDQREFRRYLDRSLGSLSALACLLLLARDLAVMDGSAFGELEALRDHADRLTRGLYRALGDRSAAREGKENS